MNKAYFKLLGLCLVSGCSFGEAPNQMDEKKVVVESVQMAPGSVQIEASAVKENLPPVSLPRAPKVSIPAPLPTASEVPIPTVTASPFVYPIRRSSGGGASPVLSNSVSSSSSHPTPEPTLPPNDQPYLDDVLYKGENIKKIGGDASFSANYLGKEINLNITGYFYNPRFSEVAISIDNGIPLKIDSVTNTSIKASFNTHKMADLYLVGHNHLLTVRLGEHIIKTNIRVDSPDIRIDLTPRIDEVKVIVNDESSPVELKLIGQNFMLNPNFAQCKLDGEITPITQVELVDDGLSLSLPLQDSASFLAQMTHQITYETPFGITFKQF